MQYQTNLQYIFTHLVVSNKKLNIMSMKLFHRWHRRFARKARLGDRPFDRGPREDRHRRDRTRTTRRRVESGAADSRQFGFHQIDDLRTIRFERSRRC